jgi:transcriptional regulator with XRE-family HTH domain
MAQSGTGLGKRDAAILAGLAAGYTLEEVAEQTGVSRRTVARRAAALRPRLQEARAQALEAAGTIYAGHAAEVARLMCSLALSPASANLVPASVRLRALQACAGQAVRAVELLDLEGRIHALEEAEGRRKA